MRNYELEEKNVEKQKTKKNQHETWIKKKKTRNLILKSGWGVSKYENIFINFKGTERTSLNMFRLSRSSSKEEFCIKILKNIETLKWNFSFLNKCWFISWKFKLDLIVNCVDQPASLNVLNYKE